MCEVYSLFGYNDEVSLQINRDGRRILTPFRVVFTTRLKISQYKGYRTTTELSNIPHLMLKDNFSLIGYLFQNVSKHLDIARIDNWTIRSIHASSFSDKDPREDSCPKPTLQVSCGTP